MSLETKSLEFGDFLLDLKEKVLLRNGERLAINPKTFQLLAALVEDPGHLVEKERLIQTLWPDSFVEEANLAFTVSLLRKALGENAQDPKFIETVPRRGYRFVGDVRKRANGNGSVKIETATDQPKDKRSYGLPKLLLQVVALLMIAAVAGGLWYAASNDPIGEAPILSAKFSSDRLSTDGNVRSAVISSDGKNVVYTSGLKGREGLWLRQLESSNNIEIIPRSEDRYHALALSPTGDVLYFVRAPREAEYSFDTYRVSIFGGVPTKIVSGTQGGISISTDGEKICFIRCPYSNDEYCSVWIAEAADGKNERKMLSRPGPIRIGDTQISPDGKKIAFSSGQSRTGSNEFGLAEVDVESGAEREITKEKFFNIKHLAWLPDQRGLLITAKKLPDKNFRIWRVSSVTGEIAPLTNDSDDYEGLSLNGDASTLISTKNRSDFRLNIYQPDDTASGPRVLAEAATVGFAPNGRIFFSSSMTGNYEIWSINPDGGEQRQVTNDPASDVGSAFSPDGSVLFFESNRTGENQVWRMNADGSDQLQVTHNGGGQPQLVSGDGRWLYFLSKPDRRLVRAPTGGGDEELLLDRAIDNFALTPDASHVAFAEWRKKRAIVIVSLADKQTIKTIEVPTEKAGIVQFAWSADGKSLYYVSLDDRSENYIVWQQPLDGSMPVRIADLGPEELRESVAFAVSPDERTFAVIQGSWKHDAVMLKGLR
jgi:Tol biopolymer transport system component/DNA-binding winged helix-turn-helix (wHTH) protein